MNTTNLIVNDAYAGATVPVYAVVSIDGHRSIWNRAPDTASLAQAQALLAYVATCNGGTILTTGQTIVAPSGQTLTAV